MALTNLSEMLPRRPLSSAILHFLWQDLRGTSQARNARASMAQDIKSKALDLALSQIEKQFGKGSIMKLGEQAIEPPGHCGDPLPNIVVEPLHPYPLLSEGHTRTLAVSHKQGYARVNAQVDE